MNKNLIVGVIALGLVSPLALANGGDYAPAAPMPAADTYTPGIYLGVQAGYGLTGWDGVYENASHEDGFVGRVFLGYDFHKNFAIEAGYTQFFNHPEVNEVSADLPYAIDLVGKIKANVVDNFGLYAKVGADYLVNGKGFHFKNDDGAFNVIYGVGAYYDITPNFTMDLSWSRYGGDQTTSVEKYTPYADTYMLGAMYKFDLS